MDLSGLVALIQQVPAFSQLTGDLRAMSAAPLYLDLLRSARPAAVAALHRAEKRPLCLVTTHSAEAWLMAEQLRAWSDPPNSIFRFPNRTCFPTSACLGPWRLASGGWLPCGRWRPAAGRAPAPLVVTSARALLRKTLPPREFLLGMRTLRVGQSVNLDQPACPLVCLRIRACRRWSRSRGPTAAAVASSTSSRRSGNVPVRLELFGDAIDSLRAFDPATQRSLTKLESMTIIPAREALPKYGPVARQSFATLDCSACHVGGPERVRA